MKHSIFADSYGLAIFDPVTLIDFLQRNQIKKKNLYNYFTQSELGDKVMAEGVLFPIYPIIAYDYEINISNETEKELANQIIVKENLPLVVTSGRLCIASISVIESWNTKIFEDKLLNKLPYDKGFIIDVSKGNYSMSIVGYYEAGKSKSNLDDWIFGYSINITKVKTVPAFSISDFQFEFDIFKILGIPM
jgi:hypothetical protein